MNFDLQFGSTSGEQSASSESQSGFHKQMGGAGGGRQEKLQTFIFQDVGVFLVQPQKHGREAIPRLA